MLNPPMLTATDTSKFLLIPTGVAFHVRTRRTEAERKQQQEQTAPSRRNSDDSSKGKIGEGEPAVGSSNACMANPSTKG